MVVIMIKLNADLTQGLDVFKNRIFTPEQQHNSVKQSALQPDAVSLETNEQQSFTFFYRSVQSRVEQRLDISPSEIEKNANEKLLAEQDKRAEHAANNILKFIEHQLQKDKQDGSTLEQLTSRIQAATEGFELGYAEANQTLNDMDLLSPNLKREISLTQEKVLSGIEQLKQEYLSTDDSSEENSDTTTTPSNVVNETSQYQSQSASVNNEFSFELTTADGDKVTINVNDLYASSQQAAYYSGSRDGQQIELSFLSQQEVQQSQFSFSVEGELDEAELKAINGLLNKVNDLAVDFYEGDVNTAFNKALELNYDSSEISEFSISMTQIKNFTAYQAYQTNTPIYNANAVQQLKPLADFANELVNIEKQMEELFVHPRNLISEVMQQIDLLRAPVEYPQNQVSFAEFANTLLDQFTAHQNQ